VTARVGRSACKGSDTSGKVWSIYLSEAGRQDRALAENWKGDTEGILIFVRIVLTLRSSPTQGSDFGLPKSGLFAATVAASIIESYKQATVP
jgi:Family of unknown function (DUF6535)